VRIAVFGASGRTGRHVVQQAVARGHEVTAFVRDPSRLDAPAGALVIVGDARDAAVVAEAVAGRDAVISVLSLARPEDEPQHSDATRTIVQEAVRAGVRRIVVTANNHVLTDAEVEGGFAAAAREHRRNRAAVQDSGLAWTIAAAPWVVDEPPLGSYTTAIDQAAPGRKITTADLATFVLDAVERDDWIAHVVGVSN
jgi:putative NADH-flavin reductase